MYHLIRRDKLFSKKYLSAIETKNDTFATANAGLNIREREEFKRCCQILNLPLDCDQEKLRSSYISLVKKFHPDSGTSDADSKKFQEIETAYRYLQNKFSKDRWNALNVGGEYGLYYSEKKKNNENQQEEETVAVFDIKHTAPQHRQYLSNDGVGSGNPMQRQKQYQKYRAAIAIENVYDHRVNKLTTNNNENSLLIKDQIEAKKIKTRYGMDRLVEDLIQQSMAKGEFDNLSGKGKPLKDKIENPYVDFVTHKINQVLIDNGFVPEWINLQKEIKEENEHIKKTLRNCREKLGIIPLNNNELKIWQDCLNNLEVQVKNLNSKITKYNLLVPLLQKQMLLFKLDIIAEKILIEGKSCDKEINIETSQIKNKTNEIQHQDKNNIFSLFTSFFSIK